MVQAQNKAQVVQEIPQPAALIRLHSDLFLVNRQLETLRATSEKLKHASQAEAAVTQEIGELGKAEIAAMTAWAVGGCVGDQPEPDQKQRRALSEKLAAAHAATAAAQGAGRDVDQQIATLTEQAQSIRSRIEVAAIDAAIDEHRELFREFLAETERYQKFAAKIIGLPSFLSERGRTLRDRGNHDHAVMYLQKANSLTAKMPIPGPTIPEVNGAVNSWSTRIADLRSEKRP